MIHARHQLFCRLDHDSIKSFATVIVNSMVVRANVHVLMPESHSNKKTFSVTSELPEADPKIPGKIIIDGKDSVTCAFNEGYKEFTYEGEVHR